MLQEQQQSGGRYKLRAGVRNCRPLRSHLNSAGAVGWSSSASAPCCLLLSSELMHLCLVFMELP